MKNVIRMCPYVLCCLAVLCCLTLSSRSASGQTIDAKDWFILTPDSYWHYTGEGQTNSSAEDDFTNTVLDEKIDVGNNIMATRIEMTADEPSDDMNKDQMFWYADPNDPEGKLYFCGFHEHTGSNVIPAQDIILDTPLLVGGNGQIVGDIVSDTGSASVKINSLFGPNAVSATIRSEITYKELIPRVKTPVGTFTNVLRMIVKITGEGSIMGITQQIDLQSGEFWLKEGVGMILQDQNADIDDAQIQIIDGGKVGGTEIEADISGGGDLVSAILLLRGLCGMDPEGLDKLTDISNDNRRGLEEAIYELQRAAGLRIFSLGTSAFSNSDPVPQQYTDDAADISPPLFWSNAPINAQSFVLIMDDPDAPGGTWDHWIIYDIPAAITSFDENAGAEGDANLPSGAKHGTNSWTTDNSYYRGPSPPEGTGTHHYYFRLYALSVSELNPADTGKAGVEAAMEGRKLDQTEFIGTYTRD